MGRSIWFECSKCGYRAVVSGRVDRGRDFFVQTIVCRDCKQLYDAVTRLRVPNESKLDGQIRPLGTLGFGRRNPIRWPTTPPTFQNVLNRLAYRGVRRFKWLQFKLQCPVSAAHQVSPWNDPGKCPRCGLLLEKNAVSYRIWD